MTSADDFRDAEQRRFLWRCRRGMLELDIVLQAFVSQHFDTLDMEQLQAFDAILSLADNDFWALINGADVAGKSLAIEMNTVSTLMEKIKSSGRVNE